MALSERGVVGRLQTTLDGAVAAEPHITGAMARVESPRHELSWNGASGFDDREALTPQSADRQLRIASVTKLFVSAVVFRLQEEGDVSLQQTIDTLLSNDTLRTLKEGGYDSAQITVAQLLSHTSGMQDHASSDEYLTAILADPQRRWSRSDQIELAMSLGPPLFDPGLEFQYSDTGYVVLGEVIERLKEDRLSAIVRGLLGFADLGLTDTYWELEDELSETPDRVRQYIGEIDARDFHASLDLYGGGGLVSTLSDLTTFDRALFSGRLFRSANTLAGALIVPRADRQLDSHIHSYLGMVMPMGRTMGWGHLGFWGCGIAWCPATDLSISVSINQAQTNDENLLRNLFARLGDVVLAEPS